MEQYPRPGNVRELQNVVEQVVVMAQGAIIEVADLPSPIGATAAAAAFPAVTCRCPIADELYTSLVDGRITFWTDVAGHFVERTFFERTSTTVSVVRTMSFSSSNTAACDPRLVRVTLGEIVVSLFSRRAR
jgi:DNA-binding NtrC family response regulator